MTLAFSLLLAFLAVCGFRMELTTDYLALVNTESFIWLLVFLFFARVIYLSIREKDKRLKIFAAVFAVISAVFYVLGISISKMYRLSWIWETRSYLLNTFLMFFGHTVLYYSFAFLSFRMLKNAKTADRSSSYKFSMKRVLIFWVIFLVCYIPWYLTYYPGLLSPDSITQIKDALSLESLNNHHSAILDLVIRGLLMTVHRITGSYQTGIGVCIFLQMLAVTFSFAFSYEWIRRYIQNKVLNGIVFLWFALFPIHNLYSVILWKDILFSICFLFLLICIDSAANDEDAFFLRWQKVFLMFLCLLLLPLMRHNGFTVTIALPIFFLFRFKKFRKQILLGFSCVLLLFFSWKFILIPMLHVTDVHPAHVYSFMEQQIVRTLDEHRDEMTEEEQNELQSYFSGTEIWNSYNPRLSDPVKERFLNDRFRESPSRFFTLWLKTGLKFPITYIEAFLINDYGFWFPEVNHWISDYSSYEGTKVEDIHPDPMRKVAFVEKITNWMKQYQFTKTPVLFLLFSPGAYWWLWIFCGCYCLYRNWKKFVLFMTGLFLWVGILFVPLANDFRIGYGLIIGFPLVLFASLCGKDEVNKSQSALRN